ncbi:MAG: hypothetical protein Ct9H90mP8_3800 [Pseudomonadota bacterium]|nr:MAG: hypothetical protein Ct9H90mP8_3800 [Pseudomonadota bacterium]
MNQPRPWMSPFRPKGPDLMKDLIQEFGMAILFITHDLGVIAQVADRVAVMYLGRSWKADPSSRCFTLPLIPNPQFAQFLPKLDALDEPLTPPPVTSRALGTPSRMCLSHPLPRSHCRKCSSEIPISVNVEPGHQSACFLNESPVEKTA